MRPTEKQEIRGSAYRRLHSTVGAVVVVVAVAVAPAGAVADTLVETLAQAYRTNPTLEAERARLRAIDETVSQARAGWRPDVRLLSDFSYVNQDTRGSLLNQGGTSDGSRTLFDVRLRVTQNLYDGGGTTATIRQRQNEVSAGRARLRVAEQSVLLDAVTAYMNVVRDQAVLRLTQNNEEVLQRQLEATRDRFNVGEVTRTDVAQAESRYANTTARRIQAEGDLEVSRSFYRQIVGARPGPVAQPQFPPNLPASEEEAEALARDGNPSVIAVLYDERAADNRVAVEMSALYPNLDLVGQAGRARSRGALDRDVDDVAVTAQLTVPLYQQGLVYSRVREAKQLRSEALARIEETRRAATEDAATAWEVLVTARANIRSRGSEVQAARIALEGVQQEAEVGARTVLDVLDAEQEFLDAQVNLVTDERNAIVAAYGLLAAVGRLTAQDLGLAVDIYDPDRHYQHVNTKWWGTDILQEPAAQPVK